MSRAAAIAIAGLAGACVSPSSSFTCDTSDQCTVGGTCQPNGFCSFPDGTCLSGQRYGEAAGGGLAGICVGDEPPDAAGEPDARQIIDGPPPPPDGTPDAMVGTCTAPFAPDTWGCHAFFEPMVATFDGGRTFCQTMGADLPVIQTLDESNFIGATLTPASAERAQIGLDLRSGTPTWVDGSGLTFTNWQPGEPGGSENIAVIRPEGTWAGRVDTEQFFVVCEKAP